MKERQILMSAPMVRATLDGSKTQTRRAAKLTPSGHLKEPGGHRRWHPDDPDGRIACPYGQPGDRLYVRETWQHSNHPYGPLERDCAIFYRADYFDDPHGMDGEKSPVGKYREWRPSIHMPRWASRITLEITGVRVERIQQISSSDLEDEGISQMLEDPDSIAGYAFGHAEHHSIAGVPMRYSPEIYGVRAFWDSINGAGSWDANPWVWVIDFRRIEHSGGGRE